MSNQQAAWTLVRFTLVPLALVGLGAFLLTNPTDTTTAAHFNIGLGVATSGLVLFFARMVYGDGLQSLRTLRTQFDAWRLGWEQRFIARRQGSKKQS